MNPERTFLIWSEGVMVKVQNATGVPIWKYGANTMKLWAIICLAVDLAHHRSVVVSALAGAFVFLSWSYNRDQRRAQDTADQSAQVVPNHRMNGWMGRAIRMLGWVCIDLAVSRLIATPFTPINVADNVSNVIFFAAVYLASYNYWPITGSTIFEQIRAGLRRRVLN